MSFNLTGSGGTSGTGGISFAPTSTTTVTSSGFSFAPTTTSAASGASFNFSAPSSQTPSGSFPFSFSPAVTTTSGISSVGFNFTGTPAVSATGSQPSQTSAASTFSFSVPASSSAAGGLSSCFSLTGSTTAPVAGLSLGTTSAQPFNFQAKPLEGANESAKLSASTTAATVPFPAKPSTGSTILGTTSTTTTSGGSSGLSSLFSTQAPASVTTTSPLGSSSTVVATSASSTSAAVPALATLTTATSTSSAASAPTVAVGATPTLSVGGLEEKVNKWVSELREQEERLMRQAAHVNAWDQLLQQGHDQVQQLRDTLNKVKTDQTRLQAELDFIQGQQQELEQLIEPLETAAATTTPAQHQGDRQRENMHHVAQSLDAQLRQMTDDLCKIIEHLNTNNMGSQASDPVNTVARVLSAHMDTLKWVDQNAALLTQKIDEMSRTADSKRRD